MPEGDERPLDQAVSVALPLDCLVLDRRWYGAGARESVWIERTEPSARLETRGRVECADEREGEPARPRRIEAPCNRSDHVDRLGITVPALDVEQEHHSPVLAVVRDDHPPIEVLSSTGRGPRGRGEGPG